MNDSMIMRNVRKKIKALFGITFSLTGAILFISMFFIVIICGTVASISGRSDSSGGGGGKSTNLPETVEQYRSMVTEVATQYEMSEYVNLILAIMTAESGGNGTDPMQASESGYNTLYPHLPGAITDPNYSIECGVQVVRDSVRVANVGSANDIPHIKVALQGYNFGNGYIPDAQEKAGGLWEQEHVYDFARRYSNEERRVTPALIERIGPWAYGDQHYPEHVLIYYRTGGNGETGEFVNVALSQLGNVGGEPYWRFMGFSSRVEWCACFVSWCGNECGYIDSGIIKKTATCSGNNGMFPWFQQQGRWKSAGEIPSAGDIIFFDWENCGEAQHVGIVERVEGNIVHTIEGNSNDMCRQREYDINSKYIFGYGIIG